MEVLKYDIRLNSASLWAWDKSDFWGNLVIRRWYFCSYVDNHLSHRKETKDLRMWKSLSWALRIFKWHFHCALKIPLVRCGLLLYLLHAVGTSVPGDLVPSPRINAGKTPMHIKINQSSKKRPCLQKSKQQQNPTIQNKNKKENIKKKTCSGYNLRGAWRVGKYVQELLELGIIWPLICKVWDMQQQSIFLFFFSGLIRWSGIWKFLSMIRKLVRKTFGEKFVNLSRWVKDVKMLIPMYMSIQRWLEQRKVQ